MKYLLIFMLTLKVHRSFSQKPPVDTSTYRNWSSVNDPLITNDGKYVMYTVKNTNTGSNSLVIVSTNGAWKKEIINTESGYFTSNCKKAIYKLNDNIYSLYLGENKIDSIENINDFNIQGKDNQQWLAYRPKDGNKKLVIQSTTTSKVFSFKAVEDYKFSSEGNYLITLVNDGGNDNVMKISNLRNGETKDIWEGHLAQNIMFDNQSLQIAFISNDNTKSSLWHYKIGEKKAQRILDNDSIQIGKKIQLENIFRFNSNGKVLFFNIKESGSCNINKDVVKLNIWSFTDSKIQPQQLNELENKTYTYAFFLDSNKVIRIQYDNERVQFPNSYNDDYLIIYSNNNAGDSNEGHWNSDSELQTSLFSITNQTRVKVHNNGTLSPLQHYYIYYDYSAQNYFSYEIGSGITRNITNGIKTVWTSKRNSAKKEGYTIQNSGWINNDEAILLHDEYDIWQIDPKGENKPLSLTNGYGKIHSIFFERIEESPNAVSFGSTIVLASFDRVTKKNGFYKIKIGYQTNPQLLSEGNYYQYARLGASGLGAVNLTPLKSEYNKSYVIRRMSANHSPNFFFTKNFKSFLQLSNIQPHKRNNWYTTELHEWTSPNKRILSGVLYKPENFNPEIKYPLIIHYYEIKSDMLNCYIALRPSEGSLNIPWYVSNGYLVFTPDIHYNIGDPLEGTYDCVVSAAKYLSDLPFVNSKKIGIQGFSWGGVQTNYLITQTNLFAAASSSASISDFISAYNGLGHFNNSAQITFERGQIRVGSTPWERSNWYINNSPIMNANKVTTPLLMMQTTIDEATRFDQAIEMFNALRRLKKKVWLLEYTDGHHSVSGRSAEDFTIRLQQFFDHYLKDAPAPKWMTMGRPARLKGIDERLDLDLSGITP